ncbi:MAG TPA: LON peptidase substrate-binding domain-containing protein [Dermatophilaceae bacterium]|nr:LON peptidase substrate-binding domain-containing protein [Dermatophilaceae bacterium]
MTLNGGTEADPPAVVELSFPAEVGSDEEDCCPYAELMSRLPIFPLGTVLVPGAQLPLRIFEPRYVSLLRDVLDHPEQDPEFGVIAIRSGQEVGPGRATDLYGIGCAARVYRVDSVGDGVFEVLTRGVRRFRLDGFDDTAATPYLTGRVTWLEDPPGDPAVLAWKANRVRSWLAGYLQLVPGRATAGVTIPADPEALSYRLTELIVLDNADRQRLLSCPDAGTRLELGARLLRREQVLVAKLGAMPYPTEYGDITPN